MPKKGQFTKTGAELLQQLLAHTYQEDACLIWKGGKTGGRGRCSALGKVWSVPTLILYLTTGANYSSYDIVASHECDNPACINPDHLRWESQWDNIQEAIAKGRYTQHQGINNYGAKLAEEQVREIISLRKYSTAYLAKKYGVSSSTINRILSGARWQHLENS